MIKKSLLFFVLLMLGHSAFAMQPNSPQDLKRLEQSNARILGLLTYSEKAIAWRQLAVDAYFEMIDYASEHSGKFKADQLLKMHKGSTVYIRHIRRPIVEILREKEFFMDFKDAFIIQTEHPTTVTDKVKRVIDNNARRGFNHNRGNKWKTVRYKQYSVNPLDLKGQLYLRSLKLGLVSALTLLDNFSIAMHVLSTSRGFKLFIFLRTKIWFKNFGWFR